MNKPLTLLILALAGAIGINAAPVSQNRACDIALAFASAQKDAPASLAVKSAEMLNSNLYMVNFAPKGFAIVSADDNAEPIMAFSFSSNMNANSMPENMAYMVKETSQAVATLSAKGTQNVKWRSIESGRVLSRAEGEDVEPLITVNFDQGSPFNKYCPGEGTNKAVVGCVAVAMSQAMTVQRYPDRPQGQVSYGCPGYGTLSIDFDKENPYNWDDIISGKNNRDETARLLYHAGMSVQMGYGADGSGIPSAQVNRISNALRNNFGYGREVTYHWRSQYTDEEWEQMLLNELYANRAVVYNAIDSKGNYGHSFNLDGFRQGLYHINWGWGGYGNAYFNINALKDAQMNMNYDSNHVIVVGIGAGNSLLKSITLSDLTVEANLPAGTPVAVLKVNGAIPTSSEMTINVTGEWDNTTSDYKESSFKYQNGLLVTTRPIDLSEGSVYVRVQAVLKDANRTKLSQGFNIAVEEAKPLEAKTAVKYDRATKMFTVHTKFGASYTVKNAEGAVVATGTITDDPDFTFNRSSLTPGNNTIEVTLDGKSKTINLKL